MSKKKSRRSGRSHEARAEKRRTEKARRGKELSAERSKLQPWFSNSWKWVKTHVTVSLLTLLVTAGGILYPIWNTQLESFKPTYAFGPVLLHFGTATPENLEARNATGPEFDPLPGRVLGPVTVGVAIAHESGQHGLVRGMRLRLNHRNQSDSMGFVPRLFITDDAVFAQDQLAYVRSGSPFAPYVVARGSVERRLVLFQPDFQSGDTAFPGGRLRLGDYTLDLLISFDGKNYQPINTFRFAIDRKGLEQFPPQGKWAVMD